MSIVFNAFLKIRLQINGEGTVVLCQFTKTLLSCSVFFVFVNTEMQ